MNLDTEAPELQKLLDQERDTCAQMQRLFDTCKTRPVLGLYGERRTLSYDLYGQRVAARDALLGALRIALGYQRGTVQKLESQIEGILQEQPS